MKEVISKLLIFAGIVSILVAFVLTGALKVSDDSNKKVDAHFSESILP